MELEELRQKLDGSNKYQIDNIRTSHSNHANVLTSEISDLKTQIEFRDH